LGPGTVLVKEVSTLSSYQIRYVGQYDVDEPTLQSNNPSIAIAETVKGDPTLAASFTEAFRSRSLGLNDGLPSPFQNGLSASDGSNRVDEVGAIGTQITGNNP